MRRHCCHQRNYDSTSSRYSVGPTIEVGLRKGFAISAEALRYRVQYRYDSFTVEPFQSIIADTKYMSNGHFWEIPIVLKKYYPVSPRVRAFPLAGLSLRHTNATDISQGWLHFHPSLRYTRWLEHAIDGSVQSNPNVFDVLIGFGVGK